MSNKKVTAKLSYIVWVLSIVCAWTVFLAYAASSRKYNVKLQTLNFLFTVAMLAAGKFALESEKVTSRHEISAATITGILGAPYLFTPGCGTVALLVPLIYGFSGTLKDEYGDGYVFDLKQCIVTGITASFMMLAKTLVDHVSFTTLPSKLVLSLMNTFVIIGVTIQTALLFYNMESRQEELIEHIDAAKEEATIDPLTGIQNRSMLEEVITRQQNSIDTFSLIIMDIDNFKKVNDTYGHVFGDTVLKRLAKILVKVSEDHSIPFRYGGEEFVVVCKNMEIDRAAELAEKIRIGFKNSVFGTDTQKNLHFTVSIGITEVPYGSKAAPSELIARSDEALYRAKKEGKDRVVEWQPDGCTG